MVSGAREAPSHAVLGQDLLSDGILLTFYEEKRQPASGASLLSRLTQRVPIIERVLFARYFSLMLRAGLDVKRSLAALEEQSRSRTLKFALSVIYQDIERGKTLAESMERFPAVFPPIFTSFIRVGEATGRLQESLGVLAEQLRKEYELRRAVRGAMLYPLVILVALLAVGFAMMVFVIPKLAEVFRGFDVELPLPTRILLAMGEFFEAYWYVVLVGLLLLGVGGWGLLQVKSIKHRLLHGLLYTPILGPIVQQVNLARFCRNLSSLLRSGVSFVEALGILGENTPHPSYAVVFKAGQEHVKQGKTLSEFLSGFRRLFPLLVVNVVKVGEETGELDKVLAETALFFEGEVDQTMKNLTSILEPILMVIIGLAVGALAISVISPIYNLVNVI
jgi:type IV pilus assembly protein PilC